MSTGNRTEQTVPLGTVREGSTVRVVSFDCGRGMACRLASMGLRPGAVLRLLKSEGRGPIVIGLGNSRFAIGRGVTHRIFVAPEEKEPAGT